VSRVGRRDAIPPAAVAGCPGEVLALRLLGPPALLPSHFRLARLAGAGEVSRPASLSFPAHLALGEECRSGSRQVAGWHPQRCADLLHTLAWVRLDLRVDELGGLRDYFGRLAAGSAAPTLRRLAGLGRTARAASGRSSSGLPGPARAAAARCRSSFPKGAADGLHGGLANEGAQLGREGVDAGADLGIEAVGRAHGRGCIRRPQRSQNRFNAPALYRAAARCRWPQSRQGPGGLWMAMSWSHPCSRSSLLPLRSVRQAIPCTAGR
jgi:hypothetical protein